MDFWISGWISGFQSGFLDFKVDFWISEWISGFQSGFLDFWISDWISGFQIGFPPTVYEISLVTDPSESTLCLAYRILHFIPNTTHEKSVAVLRGHNGGEGATPHFPPKRDRLSSHSSMRLRHKTSWEFPVLTA